MVNLAAVQAFFFEAMAQGWAAGAKAAEIPGTTPAGYKAIHFRRGNLWLLDYYCAAPVSDKSVGSTVIWYKDAPVWQMNYGGAYPKAVIPLLKQFLLSAYREQIFVGGRGPLLQVRERFIYHNKPQPDDFSYFAGKEEIWDSPTGLCLGWHDYWGMSLL